jgi:hypothetical protein
MYLLHQTFTVPLNRFSPDESILVGFGFNLCPVNVFHIQADEAFGREKKYGLRKHLVDFRLHPVAETVDGNEIRFLISGQPDIMDVTVKELSNFPAGVDVVHIGDTHFKTFLQELWNQLQKVLDLNIRKGQYL